MIVTDLFESHQTCPKCGGPAFSDLVLAEKKDACYSKVRSRYKVWPSAYASGALVQCRKKGAANWGNKSEGVAEAINPDITNPEFSHQQQIGDYLYVARYWSKGLKITAYDGAKKIGHAELMYQSAPFDDFADPKTTPKRIWLESEWTHVDPKYQRQGIMSTMYAYAKMLGNSVKPSQTRSDDAKAAWKSWRDAGDAQHLTREGVAEGLVGDVVVHNYTKIPIDLEPGQAQIAGWGPNDEPLYRVKGQDGKEVKTWSKRRMLTIAKEQGVAEAGPVQGEYSRVLTALRLYYPRFEIEELNTPDWHRVIANKANVTPEYARQVIDDFVKASQPDEEENLDWMDDTNDVREGVAEEFGPLPKDNQQIRLGRHTVDIERVGRDKDYFSFAWNDSQGQGHYEEVPVGDLGSYDDLIDRIKQEISHQERQYTDQGVAEAGYGHRNPDLMSPGDYDRYQQDQMDHNKRDFKRREHEAEWEQEKAYSEKLAARDAGTWYIRINGKLLKDRQGQPYTFQGKAAANRAAATMMAKPFNAGKQFTLTTTAADRT